MHRVVKRCVSLITALSFLYCYDILPVLASELPTVESTALPSGAEVVEGVININQAGTVMTIDQLTERGIINWQTFNIGADATVNFNLLWGPNAVTLNNVLGGSSSQILGNLTSNGQLILSNPNGIYFGPMASVDAGSLVASVHSITKEDFLSGKYHFTRDGAVGSVVNEGNLSAGLGGYVALLAPEVRNSGVIVAKRGTVALASGENIDLMLDGNNTLIGLRTTASVIDGLVANQQAVLAPGGLIILSVNAASRLQGAVINNTGHLEADSLVNVRGKIYLEALNGDVLQQGKVSAPGGQITVKSDSAYFGDGMTAVSDPSGKGGLLDIETSSQFDAVARHTFDASGVEGGKIKIDGGEKGSQMISSTLKADGSGGKGGDIQITASEASLLGASVSVDGVVEGGSISLGGEWQGTGRLRHAYRIFVNAISRLSARASAGKGGSIAVWSTESTLFSGEANASGVSQGGQIETSSKGDLGLNGKLIAGMGGKVLLDPKNLIIANIAATLATWKRSVTQSTFSISTIGSGVDSRDFGQGLALDGDLMALSHYSQDSTKGSVYLFTGANSSNYGSLALQTRLGSEAGASGMPALNANDGFGRSLSLDNGNLAVGAWGDSTYKGAVYLFNGAGSNFSGLTYRAKITSSSGATNMPSLSNYSYFGKSVSLDGDRMVVGAIGDPAGGFNTGAAYLFSGLNSSNFSSVVYRNKIVSGATSVAAGMPTLGATDWFGYGVSLDGSLLAVGAPNNGGGVHLFYGFSTADNSDFSGLTWYGELSSGTTSIASGMPTYTSDDSFGDSVALSGGRLAVGSHGDDTGFIGAGSLYVFTGTANNYSGLAFDTRIRSSQGASGMPALGINHELGKAIALDGDHLAGGGQGLAHFFNLSQNSSVSDTIASATYLSNPSADSTVTPTVLLAALNAGTDVTLQANNDITISNAISANNPIGNGGALSLYAGRHITINAAVTTDNGNFTAVAGDSGANSSFKDSGTPALTVSGALNTGTGAISLTSSGTISGTGSITASNQNLTLSAGSGTGTLFGVVGLGSGTVTKEGSGTVVLSGVNTYTGATTVNAGTLAISNASGLGTNANGTTIASGATLDLRGVTVGSEAITLNGGTLKTSSGTSSLSGAVTLGADSTVDVSGVQLTLSGAIGGNTYGITKTGTGKAVLSGNNTYTGVTTINAGTLALGGSNNRLSDSTAVTVASGATFDLANFSDTVGSIGGAGSVSLGSATLTSGGNNSDTTLSGVVSGSGQLVKSGTGTMILSRANTYTGATTVNAGTLTASHASGLGGTAGGTTVASGATLHINGVAIGSEAVTISGTGVGNLGALKGSGVASLSGALSVNSSATVGGTGSLTLGQITLSNDQTLTMGTGAALNLATGAISGTAGGGASNLTVNTTGSFSPGNVGTDIGAVSIAAANTTLSDVTANGTIAVTDSGANGVVLNGVLTANASNNADALRIAADKFTNSYGVGALSTPNGTSRWLVWSNDPALDNRNGLAYNFKQYNATFGSTEVLGSGNGFLYELAPVLNSSLTGAVSKAFDGTRNATLTAANYSVSGAVDGDSVSLNNPTAGLFDTSAAGANKLVTVSGLSSSATNGSSTVHGYQVASSISANIGTITATATAAKSSTTSELKPPPPPSRPMVIVPKNSKTPSPEYQPVVKGVAALQSAAGARPVILGNAGLVRSVAPGGVLVQVLNPPTQNSVGLVTVQLPKENAAGAAGFTVALPGEVRASAESRTLNVTMADNSPLPSWISYSPGAKDIIVTSVPQGMLPVQVMITAGTERTIMVISKESA